MMQRFPNEGEVETVHPTRTCGFCAYYKTPKCTFQSEQAIIKKADTACVEFYLDRHLAHLNRKPKLVLRHHGKR